MRCLSKVGSFRAWTDQRNECVSENQQEKNAFRDICWVLLKSLYYITVNSTFENSESLDSIMKIGSMKA